MSYLYNTHSKYKVSKYYLLTATTRVCDVATDHVASDATGLLSGVVHGSDGAVALSSYVSNVSTYAINYFTTRVTSGGSLPAQPLTMRKGDIFVFSRRSLVRQSH